MQLSLQPIKAVNQINKNTLFKHTTTRHATMNLDYIIKQAKCYAKLSQQHFQK